MVHGNLLAADAPLAPGNLINVACHGSVTVNSLAAQIGSLVGRDDIAPVHGPDRSGDVKHSMADVSKAKELLGYEPVVPFSQGLAETVQFYMEHGFGK